MSGPQFRRLYEAEWADWNELPVYTFDRAVGPVFEWTRYEEGVLRNLIELYPDLAAPLSMIIDRLYDLHPVVKENYYHPKMLGSWSIKAVMPTINPEMDYAKLQVGIRPCGSGSNQRIPVRE